MGLFTEWLEKKALAESDFNNPMSQQTLGGNPLMSGLEKVRRGLQSGKIAAGGYQGLSVVASTFGLSPEEAQELVKYGIVLRGQDGMDINDQKLVVLQRQLNPGLSSQIKRLQTPVLPPPPRTT